MWEGQPIESTNGWPVFDDVATSMSNSMIQSSSSPKLIKRDNQQPNSQRHYSEVDEPTLYDEMLALPVNDEQVR